VDDGADGNGRLDPGETASLVVRYTNTGGAPAMAPVAEFFAANPYLTILNDVAEPGMIPAGEYADVEFTVKAHSMTMQGTLVDLTFTVEDGHFFDSEQLLIIGQEPQQTIGEGSTLSNQYPFYNYFKANRSQMLYLASELGSDEKTITDIGFNILQAASQYNNLPNFVIRMKHVAQNSMPNFVTTGEEDVVFEASAYQMPTSTGWHVWELQEPFEYDGESNLLVEIVWGLLPQWTSTYYRVASTTQSANMVAYGYNDNNPVPNYNGSSAIRPNIWFAFEGEAVNPPQEVTFKVKNQLNQLVENATIMVGSYPLNTDGEGEAQLELRPGTFSYNAIAEGHRNITNQFFNVQENATTINVNMTRVFEATFTVKDQWGSEVHGATITIAGNQHEAGKYLIDDLVPGNHSFKVNAEHYFEYSGTLTIAEDDVTVEVVLTADGTGIPEDVLEAIQLFPNPATDFVTLSLPAGITADITLINMMGETISFQEEVSGSRNIGLRNLPTGNYLLRITTPEGTVVKKVSKVR
jgi:hypothetical protein